MDESRSRIQWAIELLICSIIGQHIANVNVFFFLLNIAVRMVSDDFGFKGDDVANIDRIIEAVQDLVDLLVYFNSQKT